MIWVLLVNDDFVMWCYIAIGWSGIVISVAALVWVLCRFVWFLALVVIYFAICIDISWYMHLAIFRR